MYEKKNKKTEKNPNKIEENNMPENNEGHKNDDAKSAMMDFIAKELEKAKAAWQKDFETRIASEREDAAKLATMSSEERAKIEMERKQKDFESERKLYETERSEFEAAKELAAQGLPVNFAKMVADTDRAAMQEKIELFKAEYMKAIEAGLSQRLKGTLPRISTEKETMNDPFLNGLGM